jgi:hypothetical protein
MRSFQRVRCFSGVFIAFRLVWSIVLFIVYFICVLVDIVPISTEQLLGVDQEQLFEEEQDLFVVDEGK